MANFQTRFNRTWIDPKINPEWASWLQEVLSDCRKAKCRVCKKIFELSNMGRQAIISHQNGITHKRNYEAVHKTTQPTLQQFFTEKQVSVNASNLPSTSSALNNAKHLPTTSSTVDHFVHKDDVRSAEIIWATKMVMSHNSYNSQVEMSDIFKLMFRDSAIAKQYSMSATKASYYVVYGLAPYFLSCLTDDILLCPFFVIAFDECLNKVAQREQMDVVIRYWSDIENKVCTRYLTSVFMGHATAKDLLGSFLEALSAFPKEKLLQVSMDGPNVNWAFLRQLKEELVSTEEDPELLELGSCGLHVVHGSFKSALVKSGWKVHEFLRGLYYFFKDTPTRHADLKKITGQDEFAKKFCASRWIENSSVAERIISIFPDLRKYFHQSTRFKNTTSSEKISYGLKDELMLSKLHFFVMLSSTFEPFLKCFQGTKPMVPFLYDKLLTMVKDILCRFVKPPIIEKADTFYKLSLIHLENSENLIPDFQIDMGIGAAATLSKSSASISAKAKFRSECKKILIKTVTKLFERSPFKYELTHCASCLVPEKIALNPDLCIRRMEGLLKYAYIKKRIEAKRGEKIKQQFRSFVELVSNNKDMRNQFQKFSLRTSDKLDTLYANCLKGRDGFEELWFLVKMILVLSHGNAAVESGFSINKQMLVENLHEESLVALRQVYDLVKSMGGIKKITVTKEMLQSERDSHRRYEEARKKKINEAKNITQEEKQARKRKAAELRILQEKKTKN